VVRNANILYKENAVDSLMKHMTTETEEVPRYEFADADTI